MDEQSRSKRPASGGSKPAQRQSGGGKVDRRTFLTGAGAAAGVGLVAGGGAGYLIGNSGSGGTASASGGGGRPIKIGASLPLTGPIAAEGDLEQKAMQLAVQQANDAGGVGGRQVELVVLDVGDMNAQQMVSNFRALIDREQVDAIVGGWHLFTGPEYPIVQQAGIPYLHVNTQQANADTELDAPDDHWMIFQCCGTGIWYGRGFPGLVEELVTSGAFEPRNESIAIIAASDPYGTSIANEVRDAMEEYGWNISMFQKVVAPVSEWGPVLSRIRSDPPDIIFNTDVAVPDIAAFVRQFARNPTNSLVYGQYGPSQPQFKELAGDDANGVIWSSMTSLLPVAPGDAYREVWSGEYDTDPGLGAAGFSHDMVNLYLRGVAMAGGPENRREICEYIRQDRWRGLNGVYQFDPELRTPRTYPDNHDDPSMAIPHCYFQVQDGEDKFIAPSPYTNAEFQLPSWFS